MSTPGGREKLATLMEPALIKHKTPDSHQPRQRPLGDSEIQRRLDRLDAAVASIEKNIYPQREKLTTLMEPTLIKQKTPDAHQPPQPSPSDHEILRRLARLDDAVANMGKNINAQLESMTSAIVAMAKIRGDRLSNVGVCERLGIHRNTLARYLVEKDFPTKGKDGKWLLAEIIEWEWNWRT
jgi:hypothetical protein